MKDVRGRGFLQSRSKKSVEGLYYQRLFPESEMVECSVWGKLELSAKKMVRWKAVRKNAASFNESHRERTAKRERRVKISEEVPASLNSALTKKQSRKKENRGSGRESTTRASSREMSKFRISMVQEVQFVKAV